MSEWVMKPLYSEFGVFYNSTEWLMISHPAVAILKAVEIPKTSKSSLEAM